MNPVTLIPSPDPIGLPAPAAFLLVLKGVGFFLHAVFMTFWLAGLPAAAALRPFRPRVSERLFRAMPFALAFGINAGIVPLLFLQTLHPQFYFPATILQAAFWLLVIPLVLVAYASAYLASYGKWTAAAGGMAAACLVWVGLTFVSVMTLTQSPEQWPSVFSSQASSGAVYGLYLHLGPEPLLRFGMAAGLALGTLAAFLAWDASGRARDEAYRREARALVPAFSLLGLAVYGGCGAAYAKQHVLGLIPTPWIGLALAGVPAASAAALAYARWPVRTTAAALAAVHLAALALNAVARQLAQEAALRPWADPAATPVRGGAGSLALFLAVLVAGSIALAWMGKVAARALRGTPTPSPAPPP